MATKKDLVEAQSFSKRRLTTAFVSGAPGGREVEPHRPMKAVIGGLALTVVLVIGSMAFGWLRGSLPDGWENNKLVIAKTSGARYVTIKKTLHPVLNTTSARLLIPADQFKVITVADDKLAPQKRGSTVGIAGAPDSLTPADSLSNSGWVSCLGADNGVATGLGGTVRSTPAAPAASVVKTGNQAFVIAGGMRYPVAAANLGPVSIALGLDAAPARQAPAVWTNLFELGPELAPLRLPNLGKPAPGLPPGASVGSVLAVGNTAADTRRYLVNEAGQLEPLPDFAYALYRLGSGSNTEDIEATPAQVAQLTVQQQRFAPQAWPSEMPTLLTDQPCATLTTARGQAPKVALSTSDTVTPEPGKTTAQVGLGTGALVRAVGAGSLSAGPLLAIDQTGTSYAIDASTPDILQRLGYQPRDVAPIPQSWAELFREGPELSVRAAQTTVAATS
ncbi:type VII secretion protein EccB [Knoellia remsis]|uniref:Type VII secretion protein EccB n=1 Tax=Knoellia remsis TaxID=407159 RepID=A0A2T0UEI9_9MICO|nr:type VII secretion protein EccB [Knoellia remsis]PRY56312.1 type VII secretion protein EccB [Knoellia remsis]